MDDSKEEKLENDVLSKKNISDLHREALEESIIEETYRAIEYDEECKKIAKDEYVKNAKLEEILEDNKQENMLIVIKDSKFRIFKDKIKNIFTKFQLLFNNLVQNHKNKEILKAETTKMPERENLNRLIQKEEKKFKIENNRQLGENSGPIFCGYEDEIQDVMKRENVDSKKMELSSNIDNKLPSNRVNENEIDQEL